MNAAPGWELVSAFFDAMAEMRLFINGWLYEWNSKDATYINTKKFDSENIYALLNSLNEFMKKDAIFVIKTQRSAPFERLLKNYSKVSEGAISDNQKSAVFPAPIETDDWTIVSEEEVVLVIHHDGDPLFFLRK